MIINEDDYLSHYGILRRSGRYPWGSGSTENARNKAFLDYVDELRSKGLTDKQIVEGLNLNKAEKDQISTTELRAARTIAKNQQQQQMIRRAEQLKEKGLSNVAIGEKMGVGESRVRSLLAPGAKEKADALLGITKLLEEGVKEYGFVDIGKGVENHLMVSKERLYAAVAILKEKGYQVFYGKVRQPGTGHETSLKGLGGPDATKAEFYANADSLKLLASVSNDNGKTFSGELGMLPPIKVNPNRLAVNYDEDGGSDADGVIYVRRGVDDLSLGNANYAQVRIAVGDGHYLKGMAMYKDDMPDGVDLVFNTNKSKNDPKIVKNGKLGALKEISDDPGNPFGAIVKQLRKDNPDGTKGEVISAMNLVNEEGQWDTWSRNLSSQMLSKQSPALARAQLDMTYERRENEFNQIMSLTNPTVRKKLLQEFSDSADAAAVHLKAAALPGQSSRVILPVNSLKPNEIYAPSYNNGDTVVLIRYPHGGTFEIPELTVNNRHRGAKSLLGDAKDAVGINSKVAERLSGADFDGDTVLVIPNRAGKIKSTPALDQLKNFNPRETYKKYDGMKVISEKHMQKQMGDISNLITDMTIRKASSAEIARAVKHSMVVIDSYKHELDYKQSAADNGIKQLKAKYQGKADSGATTLISRAGSVDRVPERRLARVAEGGPIDPKTGEFRYVPTGKSYVNKQGKTVLSVTKSKKLAETNDAYTLTGDPARPIERVYADHSNRLKGLANKARLEMINTPRLERSPSAAKVYEAEVKSLDSQLNIALMNAPLERRALTIAAVTTKARVDANPHMDNTQKKRIEAQALEEARIRVGAKKTKVVIEPREWEAIQAGAISDTKLKAILDNADLDRVKELATPQNKTLMTSNKTARAQSMLDLGYTRAEVASQLGVSVSTLDRSIGGG
jgi:hypothetical protein